MRRRACLVATAAALVRLALGPSPAWAAELSAKEMLDRVDDLYRGESAYARMTMRVVTQHWTRELSLESWSKGDEQSLVRILAPKKEKGTATLKAGDNIWNYLPKVNRVIKVPSSMMGGSWMGSHFTNDDLVRESRFADDYTFAFDPTSSVETAVIACTPKEGAAVVWGRLTVYIRRSDSMPLKVEYYDEDGALARTLLFDDFKRMGGRLLPAVTRMQPANKPEERTEIRYDAIDFGVALGDDLFTLHNLQQ